MLSDIHAEINGEVALELAEGADVVVAAGDIHNGVEAGFAYLRRSLGPGVPVVMVAGNHEFYGRDMDEERALAGRAAEDHGVVWLDGCEAVIGGVRFLGATLWTDYDLLGTDLRAQSMRVAGLAMNDHRLIRVGERTFTPADARALHLTARDGLAAALARPFGGPTVVVTHHAPHERSVARRYLCNPLNPAFVSDLGDLFAKDAPVLWVHGHTHAYLDYRVSATRVVCNPLGYRGENTGFDPSLVIEV